MAITRQEQRENQVQALAAYLAGGWDQLRKQYGASEALRRYMGACRAVKRLDARLPKTRKFNTAYELRAWLSKDL